MPCTRLWVEDTRWAVGMRNVCEVEGFVASPVGACVSGPCWLVCCPNPSLNVLILWATPSREETERVVRTFDADLVIGPHAFCIDARRMGPYPDPEAFAVVLEQVAPNWERYRGHVLRCAVLLPPGLSAAVVVGFFGMAPPPFETRFFADPVAALEWCGDADPRRMLATLDQLQRKAAGTPLFLQRLRDRLDRDVSRPSIARIARSLRLSVRSLQRRLVLAGTSYRRELNRARLRKAQRLLAGTDLKITVIALEVGCASSQHLSVMFRKLTGESPSSWRAAHRPPFLSRGQGRRAPD